MKIERLFTRNVLGTTRSSTLSEAAASMARYHVGTLLVMDDATATDSPVGIVTDRDLALQGLSARASPRDLTVGEAMTPIVATVGEDADTHEALEIMRAHGVRRLAVTGRDGGIRGILSIDDVLDGLATDLLSAAAVLKGDLRLDSAGLGEVKVGG